VPAAQRGPATRERSARAAPSARRVRAIRDRLREVYGVPLAEPHGHPIAELILTVLSQSTNDRNRDVAYLRLRDRFRSGQPRARHPASPERAAPESSGWESVRDAPVDAIEDAIRPGGISKVKSARIKAILQSISDTPPPASANVKSEAGLSLDWLPSVSVPEARQYLCALPGVGRKTAACVLLFAFGMRDVPVDTHVARVGTRLGLFTPKMTSEQLHDTMVALTPPGQELELHLNLLRHGRRTCYAQRPDCAGCALRRMCPSAFQVG
jgi:endonuclease-3